MAALSSIAFEWISAEPFISVASVPLIYRFGSFAKCLCRRAGLRVFSRPTADEMTRRPARTLPERLHLPRLRAVWPSFALWEPLGQPLCFGRSSRQSKKNANLKRANKALARLRRQWSANKALERYATGLPGRSGNCRASRPLFSRNSAPA